MYKKRRWVLAGAFIITGLVLLLGSAHINAYTDTSQNKFFIVNNILLSLANILLFTGAWNALHSTPTTEEILDAAQLPKVFQDSGIVKIYETFTEIEWSKYFRKTKHVVFFFTYASSFTYKNLRYLEKLKNKNRAITIIVPDYNNDTMMDFLDRSFRYGKYSENSENPLNSTKNRILRIYVYMHHLIIVKTENMCPPLYLRKAENGTSFVKWTLMVLLNNQRNRRNKHD